MTSSDSEEDVAPDANYNYAFEGDVWSYDLNMFLKETEWEARNAFHNSIVPPVTKKRQRDFSVPAPPRARRQLRTIPPGERPRTATEAARGPASGPAFYDDYECFTDAGGPPPESPPPFGLNGSSDFYTKDLGFNGADTFGDLLASLEIELTMRSSCTPKHGVTPHQARKDKENENWSAVKSRLRHEYMRSQAPDSAKMCDRCGDTLALIRCFQCFAEGKAALHLCWFCDAALHGSHPHFHHRQKCTQEFWEDLPMSAQLDLDGKETPVGKCNRIGKFSWQLNLSLHNLFTELFFDVTPDLCDKCGKEDAFKNSSPTKKSPLYVINRGKRTDLVDNAFKFDAPCLLNF